MVADNKRGRFSMIESLFDSLHDACHLAVNVIYPSTNCGALSSPQVKQWKTSMWEEINLLGNVNKC